MAVRARYALLLLATACCCAALICVLIRMTRVAAPAAPAAATPAGTVGCRWTCDDPVCRAPCMASCDAVVCHLEPSGTAQPDGYGVVQEVEEIQACEIRCPSDAMAEEDCPMCETVCPTAPAGKQWSCARTSCEWDCPPPDPASCQQPTCNLVCQEPACAAAPSP